MVDVKHALRGLLRQPTYTLTGIFMLTLGVGAVVAMFSVIHAVLFEPLPYPDSGELVRIRHSVSASGNEIFTSSTMYLTYRAHNSSFQEFGLWQETTQNLTGNGNPEQLRALLVTDGTLPALGVHPASGRWFTAAEYEPGTTDVEPVILSHRFWQRRFGSDEAILGLEFELDSTRVRVIGVMPPDFRFLDMTPQPDVIRAIRMDPAKQVIGAFGFQSLGRLKPGVTPAQASADIERVLPIWLNEWPMSAGSKLTRTDIENWRIAPIVRPLKADMVDGIAETLWMFMGMSVFVLVISCANVANLMLLRTTERRRDFSVRVALGASPSRIARSLLIEAAAIGITGGVLGLILAKIGLGLVGKFGPESLLRLGDLSLNPAVVEFAAGTTMISVLSIVAVTVLKNSGRFKRPELSSSRAISSTREDSKTRNALVVVQVALALALMIGAALMARSLQSLLEVDPGFSQPGSVQTVRVSIAPSLIPEMETVTVTQREILDAISAIPGVSSAAIASAVPMDGRFNAGPVSVDAEDSQFDESAYSNRFKWVSPGYFNAVGTRIVAGRDISWADIENGGRVVVISEGLAHQLANDLAGAVGLRIKVPIDQDAWREVVGVAQDVFEDGLYLPSPSTVYWPARMQQFFNSEIFGQRDVAYVIRSEFAGTASLIDEVQERIWSINRNIPVFTERTLRDFYAASFARTSLAMTMLTIAGGLALALGVVGIYGIMAHVVAHRTREVGIRTALGAEPRQLQRMFLVQGVGLCSIGIVIGLLVATALGSSMSSLLFGVEPMDPIAYVAATGLILVAATFASYLPARRAAAMDPMETLRGN